MSGQRGGNTYGADGWRFNAGQALRVRTDRTLCVLCPVRPQLAPPPGGYGADKADNVRIVRFVRVPLRSRGKMLDDPRAEGRQASSRRQAATGRAATPGLWWRSSRSDVIDLLVRLGQLREQDAGNRTAAGEVAGRALADAATR